MNIFIESMKTLRDLKCDMIPKKAGNVFFSESGNTDPILVCGKDNDLFSQG